MNEFKYLFLSLFLTSFLTGCYDVPLDSEQYKKEVYIVKSDKNNYLYNIDVKFQRQESPAYVTVGCSGSLPPEEDIVVKLKIMPELLDTYNATAENGSYKVMIPEDCFRMSSFETVIPAGEIKSVIPIYINTNKISAEDNYVLPLAIESVSAYTVKEEISKIILGLNLISDYSGLYNSTLNMVDEDGVVEYTEREKKLEAITVNTLRLAAGREDEDVKKVNTNSILLKVGEDNSVEIEAYGTMNVWETTLGTYEPETGKITLKYQYTDASGKKWTVDEVLIKK